MRQSVEDQRVAACLVIDGFMSPDAALRLLRKIDVKWLVMVIGKPLVMTTPSPAGVSHWKRRRPSLSAENVVVLAC
jgi:uncharacterized protein YjhX (UPF0386 family)